MALKDLLTGKVDYNECLELQRGQEIWRKNKIKNYNKIGKCGP